MNAPFIAARTNQSTRGCTIGANTPDVECAAVKKASSSPDGSIIRLNRYAENLLVERTGKDNRRADARTRPLALGPLQLVRLVSGRTLFEFALSENPTMARQQAAHRGTNQTAALVFDETTSLRRVLGADARIRGVRGEALMSTMVLLDMAAAV